MEKIKYNLGFSNGLCVPSRGRSGGLALLWSSDTNLEIKSFSNNHIDLLPILGEILGNFFPILIINFPCLGFVVEILMRFFL